MPRGDGTGPRGMGAMTGRGLGGCTAMESGASKDRGTGFVRRIGDSGSGSDGRLPDRSRGFGALVCDLFYAWLELATRK